MDEFCIHSLAEITLREEEPFEVLFEAEELDNEDEDVSDS